MKIITKLLLAYALAMLCFIIAVALSYAVAKADTKNQKESVVKSQSCQ